MTAEERKARRKELRSTEEAKAKRREYNSTPHAKALKKEQAKRYRKKNKEKVNEAKKKYLEANPHVVAKLKQTRNEYFKSSKGKEIKRKRKQRSRDVAALWYVRSKMVEGTCLRASDIPKELAEVKRVILLIKREKRKQNEERN
jgi:hypothetical protein